MGTDYHGKRRGFWSGNWRGFGVDFLSAFFPVHFRNPFSQWFLWVLDPVWVAVFGCQYFYADTPRVVS